MNKTAIVLVSILFAACASSTRTDTAQVQQPATKNTANVENPAIASVSAAEVAASKLAAELQTLQKESAYFDFDKYAVKPEYQDAIRKQADFLKNHKGDVVIVAGNADERGSGEYNLALGERRALAVKKSLLQLGVPAAQIRTVSYGEDKPRLLCHEEKCWKENRRVDFAHSLE
jgi:peptidoglycan-associated lipoprotein